MVFTIRKNTEILISYCFKIFKWNLLSSMEKIFKSSGNKPIHVKFIEVFWIEVIIRFKVIAWKICVYVLEQIAIRNLNAKAFKKSNRLKTYTYLQIIHIIYNKNKCKTYIFKQIVDSMTHIVINKWI